MSEQQSGTRYQVAIEVIKERVSQGKYVISYTHTEKMRQRCYFCKGQVTKQRVSADFRWGNELVVIEDVPAGVCEQCGEKYFSAEVYKEMERIAKIKVRPVRQITVDVVKFKEAVS